MSDKPTPPQVRSILLGFAEKRRTPRGTERVHLRWGRLALLLVASVVFAWGAKTVALLYFYKEIRDFEEITWQDTFAWPSNRTAVRAAQGDYQVREGLARLEAGEFRSAYTLLQEGVARSPENVEGRMTLARINLSFRPDFARTILQQGLENARDNLDYIRLYAQTLFLLRDDASVVAAVEDLLPAEPERNERNTVLALAGMRASLNVGNFQLFRTLYEDYALSQNIEGIILMAEAKRRLGDLDGAIALLESFVQRFGDNQQSDPVLQRLADLLLQAEAETRAVEIGLQRVLNSPLQWQPRLSLLRIYEATGREDRIAVETEAIIRQFRTEEQAMASLAQIATDMADVQLSRRLYEVALENGYSLAVFGLLFIESHLTSESFAEAIELCNELSAERPEWLVQYEGVFNSMRAIAYYGINDRELGALYLADFLAAESTTVPLLLSVADRFRQTGQLREAQRILQRAWEEEDNNVNVLTRLLDVDLTLGDSRELAENIRELLELQRTSYELIARLSDELAGDRFVFTANRKGLLAQLNGLLAEREVGRELLATVPSFEDGLAQLD